MRDSGTARGVLWLRRGPALAVLLLITAILPVEGQGPPPTVQAGDAEIYQNWEYPPILQRLRLTDEYPLEFRLALKGEVGEARLTRQAIREGRLSAAAAEGMGRSAQVSGTFLFPVLVGGFADHPSAPYSPDSLNTRLWTPGYTAGGHQGSVYDYWQEVSYGALSLSGNAFGYAVADSAVGRYRDTTGDDVGFGSNMREWFDQVIGQLDASIDFSQYDKTGPAGVPDGIVDTAFFVHSLAGYECSGTPVAQKGFWSHRWNYRSMSSVYGGPFLPYTTADPDPINGGFIKIDDYVMQPMLACGAVNLIQIGVFAHELGHAFGLPDYYDTDDDGGGGDSEGLGHWALMSSGNYNQPTSPAHMIAYNREQLGWVTYTEITDKDSLAVDVPRLYDNPFALKIKTAQMHAQEFFIVENRQPVGFDQHLYGGGGLLIYHINNQVTTSNRNPLDYRWALEQADGFFNLENNGNRGDGGDPWPGTGSKTRFGPDTVPSSETRAGLDSYVDITLLTGSQSTMTVDIIATPAFTLQGPADAVITSDPTPVLDWSAFATPAGWGTLAYEVQIDTLSDFSTALLDTSATDQLEWTKGVVENKVYHWQVRAFDDLGNSRLNGLGSRTFTVDSVAPELSLGALRNPLITDRVDFYLVATEPLTTAVLEADSVPLTLGTVSAAGIDIRVADYTITGPGTILLHGEGTDSAGNSDTADATLDVISVSAIASSRILSGDGRLRVEVPAGVVMRDGWGMVMERTGPAAELGGPAFLKGTAPAASGPLDGEALSGVYWVDLPALAPGRDVAVILSWQEGDVPLGGMPAIWREGEGGWEPLPTAVDASARTATARVSELGALQLRIGGERSPLDIAGLELEPAWPNPFNPSTQIAFTLPEAGPVKLTIFNVRGQRVRTLLDGVRGAGRHVVTWDGRNQEGRGAASGIYLYVLETPQGVRSRKVTLIR